MRKLVLFMLCIVTSIMVHAQKDLNNNQLNLRTGIFNFLKEEGFTPEIDKDGDIKFKRQGDTYFVIIDAANESPMYLVFAEFINVPERYSETVAKLASEQLTRRFKAVKCNYISNNRTFRVAAEMFVRSSEPFKEAFYKLTSVMDSLEDEIIGACDEYADASSLPLTVTKVEIGNVYKDGTVETEYGGTIYSNSTMYFKPRITYTGNKSGNVTLKTKWYNANGTLTTGDNSPNGYSQESSFTIEKGTGKTLLLSGWGNEEKGFWEAGTYRFEIWYENTCLKKLEFEVKEKTDSSKQLYLTVMAEAMKEAYGGVPASVSVGKFNIEIYDIEADVKTTSVILVFRMPKSKSAISEDEKKQALLFCNSGIKGANEELKKNDDLKNLGLENMVVTYRLEDKYGTYISGTPK